MHQPLGGLLRAILVLLPLYVVANLVVLIPVDEEGPLVALDVVSLVGALIAFGLTAALGVLVIMFLHRARKNLDARGVAGLKWSAGWTIGGWFIPFANLVIPAQVVGEIAKASTPGAGWTWKQAAFPGVVVAWWIAWLVHGAAGTLWGRLDYDSAANLPVAVIDVVASVAAALLLAAVVRRITRDQEARPVTAWPPTLQPAPNASP